jgi:hypothetical protein
MSVNTSNVQFKQRLHLQEIKADSTDLLLHLGLANKQEVRELASIEGNAILPGKLKKSRGCSEVGEGGRLRHGCCMQR